MLLPNTLLILLMLPCSHWAKPKSVTCSSCHRRDTLMNPPPFLIKFIISKQAKLVHPFISPPMILWESPDLSTSTLEVTSKVWNVQNRWYQEYIIKVRESILLYYSTVYQLFTGVNHEQCLLRFHSIIVTYTHTAASPTRVYLQSMLALARETSAYE